MQPFQMQHLMNYELMMMNARSAGYAELFYFFYFLLYHSGFLIPMTYWKCQEPMAKAKKLHCSHLFHLPCLRSWYGYTVCYCLLTFYLFNIQAWDKQNAEND